MQSIIQLINPFFLFKLLKFMIGMIHDKHDLVNDEILCMLNLIDFL